MCLLTFSLLIGAPGLRAGVTSLAELLEISLPIAIVLGGYYLALREKHRHPNGPAPGDSRSKAP
jgi:hypothetical protein